MASGQSLMLPPLDERGLFPAGVWRSTLPALQSAFCSNAHAERIWQGLQEFIAMLNASVDAIPPGAAAEVRPQAGHLNQYSVATDRHYIL